MRVCIFGIGDVSLSPMLLIVLLLLLSCALFPLCFAADNLAHITFDLLLFEMHSVEPLYNKVHIREHKQNL